MKQRGTLPSFAILVNSCDKFDDCWIPFFILWQKFGIKSLDHAVYLCTERKHFEAPGVSVQSLCVCTANGWMGSHAPTWSWCLKKALEAIQEDFVLYFQEDYFLTKSIDEEAVRFVLATMVEHQDIGCVHLTGIGIRRTLQDSDYPGLRKGDPKDWYYVSCQAALWRKSILSSLIREHESAWQFERWASKRARWTGYRFYVLDRPEADMPVDYVKTGIIQGKWFEPVDPLFREHGIEMDFSKRGFYVGKYGARSSLACRLFRHLLQNVRAFLFRYALPVKSQIEVVKIVLSSFLGFRHNVHF